MALEPWCVVNLDNLERLCRLCLADNASINVFGDLDMLSKIVMCCAVMISKNDGLPENICETCYGTIEGTILFKNISQQNDNLLRQYLATKENLTSLKDPPKYVDQSISPATYNNQVEMNDPITLDSDPDSPDSGELRICDSAPPNPDVISVNESTRYDSLHTMQNNFVSPQQYVQPRIDKYISPSYTQPDVNEPFSRISKCGESPSHLQFRIGNNLYSNYESNNNSVSIYPCCEQKSYSQGTMTAEPITPEIFSKVEQPLVFNANRSIDVTQNAYSSVIVKRSNFSDCKTSEIINLPSFPRNDLAMCGTNLSYRSMMTNKEITSSKRSKKYQSNFPELNNNMEFKPSDEVFIEKQPESQKIYRRQVNKKESKTIKSTPKQKRGNKNGDTKKIPVTCTITSPISQSLSNKTRLPEMKQPNFADFYKDLFKDTAMQTQIVSGKSAPINTPSVITASQHFDEMTHNRETSGEIKPNYKFTIVYKPEMPALTKIPRQYCRKNASPNLTNLLKLGSEGESTTKQTKPQRKAATNRKEPKNQNARKRKENLPHK